MVRCESGKGGKVALKTRRFKIVQPLSYESEGGNRPVTVSSGHANAGFSCSVALNSSPSWIQVN